MVVLVGAVKYISLYFNFPGYSPIALVSGKVFASTVGCPDHVIAILQA
jgi:hypothetical protein